MNELLIDFIPTFLGVFAGGIVSIILFMWQKVKQEKRFIKILINILEGEEGEIEGFLKSIEVLKEKHGLMNDDDTTEEDYKLFLIELEIASFEIISKLPDLKTSYEIGVGYTYEIISLRKLYSYFNQYKNIVKSCNNTNSRYTINYADLYKIANGMTIQISENRKDPLKRLKKFEETSSIGLAIKSFIPFCDIYDDTY